MNCILYSKIPFSEAPIDALSLMKGIEILTTKADFYAKLDSIGAIENSEYIYQKIKQNGEYVFEPFGRSCSHFFVLKIDSLFTMP